jgi:hypothetical protein
MEWTVTNFPINGTGKITGAFTGAYSSMITEGAIERSGLTWFKWGDYRDCGGTLTYTAAEGRLSGTMTLRRLGHEIGTITVNMQRQ